MMQPHQDRMLLEAATVAVVPQKHGVNVTYLQGGKLQTVEAKGVIMATPKFITVRMVEGMPQKQKDAIAKMRYIPYAVVNLVYDKPVFNAGYDTWCPGNAFTDFIVADWTVRNQPGYNQKYNILTCYTPLPREQRATLLTEEGCRQLAAMCSARLPEAAAADQCRSGGGADLPPRTSPVSIVTGQLHAGVTAGASADGARLLCQHGLGGSGLDDL